MLTPFGCSSAFACALLLLGCGARSGLAASESTDASASEGTSPNALCAGRAPGEVVTLRSAAFQPASIGVSGEALVIAEWPFSGDVLRMPRTGGSVEVLSDDEPAVNRMAADPRGAFWVVQGFGDSDGALRTAPAHSSKTRTLVGSLTRPRGVALFDDALYFTDGIGPPNDSVNGRVQRLKRGKRRARVLSSGLGDPSSIAVDASGVYFADGGKVFSLPREGGTPTLLAETGGVIDELVTDGQRLFWSSGGSVYRRDHATGTVLALGTVSGLIEGIAADPAGAYLVERSGPSDRATGGVYEILENGLAVLASTSDAPLGIAIDASAIYFVAIQGVMGSVNLLCRAP